MTFLYYRLDYEVGMNWSDALGVIFKIFLWKREWQWFQGYLNHGVKHHDLSNAWILSNASSSGQYFYEQRRNTDLEESDPETKLMKNWNFVILMSENLMREEESGDRRRRNFRERRKKWILWEFINKLMWVFDF